MSLGNESSTKCRGSLTGFSLYRTWGTSWTLLTYGGATHAYLIYEQSSLYRKCSTGCMGNWLRQELLFRLSSLCQMGGLWSNLQFLRDGVWGSLVSVVSRTLQYLLTSYFHKDLSVLLQFRDSYSWNVQESFPLDRACPEVLDLSGLIAMCPENPTS